MGVCPVYGVLEISLDHYNIRLGKLTMKTPTIITPYIPLSHFHQQK